MGKRTTYVLDTTVLIENPEIMYELGDADVLIPVAVIKELDGLKNHSENIVAQAARQVARVLDRVGSYGDLIDGVRLSSGPVLKVATQYDEIDALDSVNDNKIVGTALKVKREGDNRVVLLTTDINMRSAARAYAVEAQRCILQEVVPDEISASTRKEGCANNSEEYQMVCEGIRERGSITKSLLRRVIFIATYFFVIALTGVIVNIFMNDVFAATFIGIVAGTFVYMSLYAVYLRQMTKGLPKRSYYRQYDGETTKMMQDSPPFNVYYSGHPFYRSEE